MIRESERPLIYPKENLMSLPATPNPRRWWALALLSVAQFLVILDTSIIGVALPKIDAALGFSSSSLQWVFNAYVIAFGGLLLLGGRLADLLGARRVFVGGFVLLVGASLFAGLATSEPMRSEEHTSELQSRVDLVCRLLLEKKKKKINIQLLVKKKKKQKQKRNKKSKQ